MTGAGRRPQGAASGSPRTKSYPRCTPANSVPSENTDPASLKATMMYAAWTGYQRLVRHRGL